MSEKNNHLSRESSLRRRKTAYHYRRRSKALFADQYTAELKQVLGFTLKTNCSFSCDPNSGLLAYPAGCVIVLYNPKHDRETHIFNPGQKTLTCLRFSNEGNFIVTGEAGHQPCVRVFSVHDRCQVAEFSSHKFGVSSVAFSPNGKYVVSVGYQHDNVINVWDWKKSKLAASNKVSTKIKSIAFSEDSNHFITVGNRHVKFWYLEEPSTDKITIPLKGRSAILESLRNHVFCDVVCGTGCESKYSFAITRSGILCQFNAGRTVEKFVELRCSNARSLCAIDDLVLCGCSSGSVHVFKARSLEFITEIVPVEQLRGNEIIAISIDIRNMWMHCVFDDHSFVVYDVVNLSSPNVRCLFQYHNACVWDIKNFPYTNEFHSFSQDCFITCSNDGTVRAWKIDGNKCKLLKIIKLHKSKLESKCEARSLAIRKDGHHLAVGDRSGNIHVYDTNTFERAAFLSSHEGDVLCIDFSPNGDVLASSSRDRCVHIFDSSYNPTHTVADHSAAVTSVKFAQHDTEFRLITCGADKSLYFCSIACNNSKTEINREQHFVERHSMSDMAVLDETVLVACGCNLSEYDMITGKLRRTFRGNEGTSPIVRVAVNSHRTLIATSCADKNIYLLGFTTTDCVCVLSGHSEMAVALTFDLENRLLSASADGCVFIWSLVHRSPEDARNIQSLTNNANSNVSTPDSPEMDKTTYFLESLPKVDPIDIFATPRSFAGDSVEAFATENYDIAEDLKTDSFRAESVNPQADLNVAELPTWVTKVLPGDSEVVSTETPRVPLGKWGHKLEADKICEELGNLPVSADVSSVQSSIDGDEVDDDDSSQTAVEDSQPNLGFDAKQVTDQLSTLDEDSEASTLLNESRDVKAHSHSSSNAHEPETIEKQSNENDLENSDAGNLRTKEIEISVDFDQNIKEPNHDKELSGIDTSLFESSVMKSNPHEEVNSKPHEEVKSKPHEEVNSKPHEEVKSKSHEEVNSKPHEEVNPKPHEEVNSKPHEEVKSKSHEEVKSKSHEEVNSKPHEEVNSKPHEEVKSKPHEEVNSKPHEEVKSKSHEEVKSKPQEEVNSKPHEEVNSKPHEEVKSKSHEEVKSKPQEEVKSKPQEEVNSKPHEEVNSKPHKEVNSKPHEEVSSKPHEEVNSNPHEEVNSKPHEEVSSKPHEEVNSNPHEEVNSKPHEEVKLKPHEEVKSKPHEEVNSKPHEEGSATSAAYNVPSDDVAQLEVKTNLDPSSMLTSAPALTTKQRSRISSSENISDEEIDLRRVHYQTKTEQLPSTKVKESSFLVPKEHELHSTPKNCFTTVAKIKLSPVPLQSSRQETCDSEPKVVQKPRYSELAVEVATKNLVSHVLSSVQNSDSFHDCDVIETSDYDEARSQKLNRKNSNIASATISDQINVADTKSDIKVKQNENEKTSYEKNVRNEGNRVPKQNKLDRHSRSKVHHSTSENSTSMPPAFAELLARLTKKGSNNNRVQPSRNTYPRAEREVRKTPSSLHQTQLTATRVNNLSEKVPESNHINCPSSSASSSSSSNSIDISSAHDHIDECQKASDNLMAAFSCAETVYQKHKVLYENGNLSNGSLVGFNKLSRSLQKIYSRLGQLKGVSNSIRPHPDENHYYARSASLENLANDSPIFSLLREYSDKLMGIVHNPADSELLTAPPDTV